METELEQLRIHSLALEKYNEQLQSELRIMKEISTKQIGSLQRIDSQRETYSPFRSSHSPIQSSSEVRILSKQQSSSNSLETHGVQRE